MDLPMLLKQSTISSFRRINGINVDVSIRGSDEQAHNFLNPEIYANKIMNNGESSLDSRYLLST